MSKRDKNAEKPKKEGDRSLTSARELCYIAVSVSLLAVCSWVCVPIGNIPVTLQTLALFVLCGALGARRAFLAVFVWLTLGFCGVPVFAGFTGGVGKLFTQTGGFLIGFLVAAPLMGWLYRGKLLQRAAALCIGAIVYNALGTVWFCVLYTGFHAGGLLAALTTCVLPYLLFDIAKIGIALIVTEQIKDRI